MTAKGRINASKVQAGDRILVKVTEAGVTMATTKTGEGVQVARVVSKRMGNPTGENARYGSGRAVYTIVTTAGVLPEAQPIQTMWLAPEDAAGVKRAHAEALLEDAAWHEAANALAVQHAEVAAYEEQARRDNERLEAPAQPEAHSVAANSDAYWTKGCGKQVLEQDEILALRAEFPDATDERKAEIQVRLAILGTVVYPEGTPEYEEYRRKLRAALADWVEEGRQSLVADVEVIKDEGGQPRQVAVTRVPDSGYPSTSYEPVALPQREPGAALADAMVAELVEDLADVALAEAIRPEAQEHAVRHARHARPGHTAQVQLLPLRDEAVDYASAELVLAIGSEWGRLEGRWLRVAAMELRDLEDGTPLYLLEAGEAEPGWFNAGTRSRRTGYVALVGKTLTVNSRPYRVLPNQHGHGVRLYPA